MENNKNIFESLLESATEYGKTSYDLARLKVLEKTADVVSSLIPQIIGFTILLSFLLFISFGTALWVGEILGKVYFGFFAVAGFYAVTGIAFYVLLYKKVKSKISDLTIRQALK